MANVTFTVEQVVALLKGGLSQREVARQLGKESQESTVRNMLKRELDKHNLETIQELLDMTPTPDEYADFLQQQVNGGKTLAEIQQTFIEKVKENNPGAKIFLGDVETSYTISYHFGRFKQFISPKQVIQEPYMLTFAGKWLHNPSIFSRKLPDYPEEFARDHTSDRKLIEDLWQVLDECDIFVAHNARFDRGWANQRFAYYGMQPPSPYITIDTLGALKEAFSLPSNSLEAACNYFELDSRKLSNEGASLWRRCMEGDPEAFEEMESYNIGDIPTLEELYLTVRPYMRKHPNLSLFHPDQSVMRCVRCGSDDLVEEKGKSAHTFLSKFKVYRCQECGSCARDRQNVREKAAMKKTLANIL
ncbi:putative DNA polymerase/exonuclease [Pectobacterium phage vB_PatM_CB7]|nr:putative DNA polymerase/exonuclease [Pectobacterium phage vB_PatM_CB7]